MSIIIHVTIVVKMSNLINFISINVIIQHNFSVYQEKLKPSLELQSPVSNYELLPFDDA